MKILTDSELAQFSQLDSSFEDYVPNYSSIDIESIDNLDDIEELVDLMDDRPCIYPLVKLLIDENKVETLKQLTIAYKNLNTKWPCFDVIEIGCFEGEMYFVNLIQSRLDI